MIYLLTGTAAYHEMILNATAHLLKYVDKKDIVVAVPDSKTLGIFSDVKCSVFVSDRDLPSEEQRYGNGYWGKVVHWKLSTIVSTLKLSDVLYLDSDVIVFSDIRKHAPPGSWDICVQRNITDKPCMGIVAAKSTEFAIKFLTPHKPITSDDRYIGQKWKFDDPRLAMFPEQEFPVGVRPFDRATAACYHYNWIFGTQEKIKRMNDDGNWIV